MNNLCEKCGADKDVWKEVFNEIHNCQYSSQHFEKQSCTIKLDKIHCPSCYFMKDQCRYEEITKDERV